MIIFSGFVLLIPVDNEDNDKKVIKVFNNPTCLKQKCSNDVISVNPLTNSEDSNRNHLRQ